MSAMHARPEWPWERHGLDRRHAEVFAAAARFGMTVTSYNPSSTTWTLFPVELPPRPTTAAERVGGIPVGWSGR